MLPRAELETLSDEVMQLVGMLDGINGFRFERDAQLLVAWEDGEARGAGAGAGGWGGDEALKDHAVRSAGQRCRAWW